MKFSEKLIELRKKNGLSQEELGNKINVSRQAVSKWESEQAKPEIDKVKEISKLFDVSIDYLVNDEIDNSQKSTEKKIRKKAKKVIIKVILIILAIYLVIVAYKFTVLLVYSIKANNIADYDNYNIWISSMYSDKIKNEYWEDIEDIIYSNNIEIRTVYDDKLKDDSYIEYKNSKEKTAYCLSYDYELEKYVYEDLKKSNEDNLEELYEHTTIKNITKTIIPNNVGQILLYALNPKVTVKFEDDFLVIKNNAELIAMNGYRTYAEVYINKSTGILDTIVMENQDRYYTEINYGYNFDDRFVDEYYIEEVYLEELEYVMSE